MLTDSTGHRVADPSASAAYDPPDATQDDTLFDSMGWQKRTKPWKDYPVGTRARQSWTGISWTKTAMGWKADGGDTFPIPGDSDEVFVSAAKKGPTMQTKPDRGSYPGKEVRR